MHKTVGSLLVGCIVLFASTFSEARRLPSDPPVQKGDYKMIKLDALNLMGFGVQKIHLGYEISPMKGNSNSLPTLNLNLHVPFNSLNELDINYGVEVGADLRFYQRRRLSDVAEAQGFYLGVGLDGGFVSFEKLDTYNGIFSNANKESVNEYTRVRTGLFVQAGAQSKLSDKLYFDINLGMGWSNVNVQEVDPEFDSDFTKVTAFSYRPSYLLFREGKSQRFYLPVSLSLGYNFGNR